MTYSKIAQKLQWARNYGGKRKQPISKIPIHHAAGVFPTAQAFADYFSTTNRYVNSTYVIGNDGSCICCLPEGYRPWTTGHAIDEQSITIEVSNSKKGDSNGADGWEVSEKAMSTLIKLVADIAERYNLKPVTFTGNSSGTLLMHKWFGATSCPGNYLASQFPRIAKEANVLLTTPDKPSAEGSLHRVWVQEGAFSVKSNAEAMANELKKQGKKTSIVSQQDELAQKSIDELAREVLAGQWGNDPERTRRLTAAGHDAKAVQKRVNELLR